MKVGVVGASGYAGGELLRILQSHENFDVTYIAAGSNAGEKITSVHSHLITYKGKSFQSTDPEKISQCDLVFLALPHGESANLVSQIDAKTKVVDLGADFRLKNSASWKRYYNSDYAGSWIYGLPELPNRRALLANATRVANPGCYATAVALAALPAIQNNLVDASDIVVVAASGTTGAGRSSKVSLSGSEVMNSLSSYKFGGVHQHTPEIEETLSEFGKTEAKISFTPILAPMPRGILATITMKTESNVDEIREAFASTYDNEPFVEVLEKGLLPETSSLIGSNGAHIQLAVDSHTSRLVLSVAIDNLGKGAAGQAVQNANLMCGFDETTGLAAIGIGQ